MPLINTIVNGAAAAGTAVTVTLPATAGLCHYVTGVQIELYATVARTGVAAPVVVTTTGLPGNPSWTFETAQGIGTVVRREMWFPDGLRSATPGTAVTIAAPAVTSGIWRINAFYTSDT